MEIVDGHKCFLALSSRGALSILDASFKFARASYLGGYVPSAMIGVCGGLTSAPVRMRQKKGLAFTVREGCRELASKVDRVSKRTRFKRSSKSIRVKSRALRSIAPDVELDSSSSDENDVSIAKRENCADLPEVSLQLADSTEWTMAAYDGFCREENIRVLEARSILYAARYAESDYALGRLFDPF